MKQQKVLVTGGLGYIGSHTVVELVNNGFEPIIVDDLSNSEMFILDRIEKICSFRPKFYKANLCDLTSIQQLFQENNIDVVIHFAAFKAVGESVKQPLKYFRNNLVSLINVLEAMEQHNCNKIIFSSSATIYGQPDVLPATEHTAMQKALSAYGSTKQMGEDILEKVSATGKINTIALRYFNPVGAHHSALIGELPKGIPNNLFPYVMQTATGKLERLTVFGNDYNTKDGTALRDYIHVVDLAKAHVKACERLVNEKQDAAYEIFNIGTGKGTTVLEIIQTFEKVTGTPLNYIFGNRREGDAEAIYAETAKANAVLNWEAVHTLEEMVMSSWKWEKGLSENK